MPLLREGEGATARGAADICCSFLFAETQRGVQWGEPNPAGVPQAPRSLSAKRMRPPRGLHAWPWGFFGHSHPRRGAAAVSDPLVSLFYRSPFPLLKPFPKAGAFWQLSPHGGSPFPRPCNPLSAPQSLQSNTTPIFFFFPKNIKDAAHLNNYFPFFSFSIFPPLRAPRPAPREEKRYLPLRQPRSPRPGGG